MLPNVSSQTWWRRHSSVASSNNRSASRRALMKPALLLATLSLTICVPAYAYETATGAVMICDTQKQVERYVQLFDGDPEVAIRAVNTEENSPNACALVDVSYVEGPDAGMAR